MSDQISEKRNQVLLQVFLDRRTHDSLVEFCKKNGFDLSIGFVKAAERGMRFFRAIYYREIKQDYLLLKKQAEEYENDNKTLRKLEEENRIFRQMRDGHRCRVEA